MTDELRGPAFEKLGQQFTARYGIKVQVEAVKFNDLLQTFKTKAQAGQGADILVGPHDWLGELVSAGLLLPIDLAERDRANFLPSALSGFVYNGKVYGLPYAVENVAMVRNTELVPDPPQTWTEVMEISARLEKDGKVKHGFLLNSEPYYFYPLQVAFKGYIFGWDRQGTYDPTNVGLDGEGSITAARWLEAMVREGHIKGDTDVDTLVEMFGKKEVALLVTGPWSLERIRQSGVKYAISNMPKEVQDGLPFVGVQGFMVSARGKNSDAARKFLLEFVLTEEVMLDLFKSNLRPPAFLPTRRVIDDPDLAVFAAAGSNGLPMPAIPAMSKVWDSWRAALKQILQGQPAEESFKQAAQEIRAKIANK
jgi:maltose-binding protein MalE